MLLLLLYKYLKRNLFIQLYFSTYRQKKHFWGANYRFWYFFLKIYWWYQYGNWNWSSHTYKELLTKFREKSFKNLHYFFRKCNLMMTCTCKFVALTRKLNFFWQSLLGNYYSPLNFLSIGIQYVKLFGVLIFHIFFFWVFCSKTFFEKTYNAHILYTVRKVM